MQKSVFVLSGYHGVGKTSIWKKVCLQLDSSDIVPIGEFARGMLEDGHLLNWANLFEESNFRNFYLAFELLLLKTSKLFWKYWLDKKKILFCDRSFLDIIAYCRTYLPPDLWEGVIEKECEELFSLNERMYTFVLRRENIDDAGWIDNLYDLLGNLGFVYETLTLKKNFENEEDVIRRISMVLKGG